MGTTVSAPDVVTIAGRQWTIDHIKLGDAVYFGCGILPLRRSRAEILRDIRMAQGPEWRVAHIINPLTT
jgi:hypothetical protein